MSSVDAAARLAALMRSQVVALRRQTVKHSSGRVAAKAGTPPQDNADFASIVAQRLKGIDPDDPQREQKAIRIYLESVILAELGPGLVSDPAFGLLIDDVQKQMTGDPEMAKPLAEAAAILLGGSPGQ